MSYVRPEGHENCIECDWIEMPITHIPGQKDTFQYWSELGHNPVRCDSCGIVEPDGKQHNHSHRVSPREELSAAGR